MLKYLYNFSFHPNNFTFELNETCQFKLKLLIITDQSFSEVQIVLSSELSCGSSQVSEFTTRFCGLERLTIKNGQKLVNILDYKYMDTKSEAQKT